MKIHGATIDNRGDHIEVQLTAEYRGKRPTKGESKAAIKKILTAALDGLEKAEYGGAVEDDRQRFKRDRWLIEGGAS